MGVQLGLAVLVAAVAVVVEMTEMLSRVESRHASYSIRSVVVEGSFFLPHTSSRNDRAAAKSGGWSGTMWLLKARTASRLPEILVSALF